MFGSTSAEHRRTGGSPGPQSDRSGPSNRVNLVRCPDPMEKKASPARVAPPSHNTKTVALAPCKDHALIQTHPKQAQRTHQAAQSRCTASSPAPAACINAARSLVESVFNDSENMMIEA